MNYEFKLLDTVALLKNIPEKKLVTGQVGTIVEKIENNIFEIEFTNKMGIAIAIVAIHQQDLLLLHYEIEAVK